MVRQYKPSTTHGGEVTGYMDKRQKERKETYKDRIRRAIEDSEKGKILRDTIKIMEEKDGEYNDNERISATDRPAGQND